MTVILYLRLLCAFSFYLFDFLVKCMGVHLAAAIFSVSAIDNMYLCTSANIRKLYGSGAHELLHNFRWLGRIARNKHNFHRRRHHHQHLLPLSLPLPLPLPSSLELCRQKGLRMHDNAFNLLSSIGCDMFNTQIHRYTRKPIYPIEMRRTTFIFCCRKCSIAFFINTFSKTCIQCFRFCCLFFLRSF